MNVWPRIAFVAACFTFLTGVMLPPPNPALRAFGDNKQWILLEDLEYTIGKTSEKVVVPRGFVTDFASIPPPLATIGLSPHGQYSRAAVIHDFLYWAQGCTRIQSDRLLLIAMTESHVGGFQETAVYEGVRKGGSGAWKSNARARDAGLPRVIPEQYLAPEDPNMQWDEYRKILIQMGVHDPVFEAHPSYCKFGNSTEVPGPTP